MSRSASRLSASEKLKRVVPAADNSKAHGAIQTRNNTFCVPAADGALPRKLSEPHFRLPLTAPKLGSFVSSFRGLIPFRRRYLFPVLRRQPGAR